MKIGNFVPAQNGDYFEGKIVTRTQRFPHLIMRRPAQVLSDQAAAFEIFETNNFGEEVQVGAAWERRRKANQELFYAGMIDDPSFSEAIPIALFGDEREGFAAQWRREREPFDGDGFRSGGNPQPARGGGFGQRRDTRGGGFSGGSTAGPGGEYVGGSRQELDDTVPF